MFNPLGDFENQNDKVSVLFCLKSFVHMKLSFKKKCTVTLCEFWGANTGFSKGRQLDSA
jgi:hypothetical protein